MAIAFLLGFSVDIFYDSIGINAAASVLIGFLRPYWLKIVTPRGGYEEVVIPNLKTLDFGWFFTYSLPLIFIHHFALFFIESWWIRNVFLYTYQSLFQYHSNIFYLSPDSVFVL
jgi:hypothetical protein